MRLRLGHFDACNAEGYLDKERKKEKDPKNLENATIRAITNYYNSKDKESPLVKTKFTRFKL